MKTKSIIRRTLNVGDPHPTQKGQVYLGRSRNDFHRQWGTQTQLNSIRQSNREKERTKRLEYPAKVTFKKIKKTFPRQSYEDSSTDWKRLEELYRLRTRLNREHGAKLGKIFQIRRKVSPLLAGLFTLENSILTVDPYYSATHQQIAEEAFDVFQVESAARGDGLEATVRIA